MANTEKTQEQELIESAGFDCQSYSGRGMYGEKCLAVVTNEHLHWFAELLDTVPPDFADIALISGMMSDAKTDSMGRGTVIYWPQLPYVGDESEESNDE